MNTRIGVWYVFPLNSVGITPSSFSNVRVFPSLVAAISLIRTCSHKINDVFRSISSYCMCLSEDWGASSCAVLVSHPVSLVHYSAMRIKIALIDICSVRWYYQKRKKQLPHRASVSYAWTVHVQPRQLSHYLVQLAIFLFWVHVSSNTLLLISSINTISIPIWRQYTIVDY